MSKIYVQSFPELLKFSGSLAAAGSISGSLPCAGYSQLVGFITSSGSSETGSGLSVQQSVNSGSEWDINSGSYATVAGFTSSCMIDIIGNAVKVRFGAGDTDIDAVRTLFQLKPVAGTAKMPDVDVDVISSGSVTVTSGSLVTTAGSLDTLKSGSVVITTGCLQEVRTASAVVTSGSIDILKSGSVVVTAGSTQVTAGSIDIVKSGSVVVTAGSVSTKCQTPINVTGAIRLVAGDDSAMTACQFSNAASIVLTGTQSGEFLTSTFLYSPTGTTADKKTPAGYVYFFSGCPAVVAGCTSLAASDYANIFGRVPVAITDWDSDSACYAAAVVHDKPIPFPSSSKLWSAFKLTSGCFNDVAGDDEILDMILTYRRDT